jgi:hypothetical protein
MRSELSVQDGLEIQNQHLQEWKRVLLPEVYFALKEYATRKNHKAESGYDIVRGQDLNSYIRNYTLGYRL